MTIMGRKWQDGKYYVDGMILRGSAKSGKPEDIFTRFLIDTSQRTTIISELEAIKHEIDYKFNLKRNAVSKNSKIFDAYEIRDIEIQFASQDNHSEYIEKFDIVLVPIENNSFENLEPSSVLGLDFLERFRISFLEPKPTSGGIILEKFQHPDN